MLTEANTLEEVRRIFRWDIPERFNMGVDICDRWAAEHPEQVAIVHDDDRAITEVTYGRDGGLEVAGDYRGDPRSEVRIEFFAKREVLFRREFLVAKEQHLVIEPCLPDIGKQGFVIDCVCKLYARYQCTE